MNEDRHKLSVAKCRSMILLSKKYKVYRVNTFVRDRPSKDISHETAEISLIFCFLAYDVTSPVQCARQAVMRRPSEKSYRPPAP